MRWVHVLQTRLGIRRRLNVLSVRSVLRIEYYRISTKRNGSETRSNFQEKKYIRIIFLSQHRRNDFIVNLKKKVKFAARGVNKIDFSATLSNHWKTKSNSVYVLRKLISMHKNAIGYLSLLFIFILLSRNPDPVRCDKQAEKNNEDTGGESRPGQVSMSLSGRVVAGENRDKEEVLTRLNYAANNDKPNMLASRVETKKSGLLSYNGGGGRSRYENGMLAQCDPPPCCPVPKPCCPDPCCPETECEDRPIRLEIKSFKTVQPEAITGQRVVSFKECCCQNVQPCCPKPSKNLCRNLNRFGMQKALTCGPHSIIHSSPQPEYWGRPGTVQIPLDGTSGFVSNFIDAYIKQQENPNAPRYRRRNTFIDCYRL